MLLCMLQFLDERFPHVIVPVVGSSLCMLLHCLGCFSLCSLLGLGSFVSGSEAGSPARLVGRCLFSPGSVLVNVLVYCCLFAPCVIVC